MKFLNKRFGKDLFKYIGVGYGSTLLNIVLNVLSIKLLDPYMLGKVALGKSIFQSFEFSHIGIRYGLDRMLPHAKTDERRNLYFSVAYIFSAFSSLLFFIFWCFYDLENVFFYAMFSISGVIYTLVNIYKIFYRAEEDKSKFINLTFFLTVFPLILQVIGLLVGGAYGFAISMLMSYLLVVIIAYRFFKINIIYKDILFRKTLNVLFDKGYLLFFSSILGFLSTTGDRFFIAKYWGLEMVGVLSVVIFFFSALSMFSLSYTELIMSKIMLNPSFKFILKHIGFSFIVSTFLLIISYFFLPFFIRIFITKYVGYIPIIKLMLLAVLPYSILPMLNYFMHAIDKRMHLLYINLAFTILYFGGLIIVLNSSRSIENIIYLKLMFNLLLSLMSLGYFFFYFNKQQIFK